MASICPGQRSLISEYVKLSQSPKLISRNPSVKVVGIYRPFRISSDVTLARTRSETRAL